MDVALRVYGFCFISSIKFQLNLNVVYMFYCFKANKELSGLL